MAEKLKSANPLGVLSLAARPSWYFALFLTHFGNSDGGTYMTPRHSNDNSWQSFLIILVLLFSSTILFAVHSRYSGTARFKGGGIEFYLDGKPNAY